ncbi:MAG: RluA family pseudouridine synthase [Kofleriaceae bacterium]
MVAAVTWFDPQPAPAALPTVMPSPFAGGAPHPLAQRAAAVLAAALADDPRPLDDAGGGKMFGVLVVRDGVGRVGFLRGFSGMLRGSWFVDGYAPPLFDPVARAGFWPAGEAALAQLATAHAAATTAHAEAQATLAALDQAQRAALARLDDELAARKEVRRAARAAGAPGGPLDDASRGDGRRRRTQVAADRAARAAVATAVEVAAAEVAAVERTRADRSRALYDRLCDGYQLINARGERRPLAALFVGPPPGGAGDCAAPKLLVEAYRQQLTPVALAELWWGPATDGRFPGRFYPACRGKCGPIVPFLVDGLAVAPAPEFGDAPVDAAAPRVVFEDAWVMVVDKPAGLLSVPGRSGRLRDSVVTRLRARDPAIAGPVVAHRLDLDTSGLLVCARDLATAVALQAQFARREVTKRYVAILDGDVAADRGTVDLPLRGDLDDRPRQRVCHAHGKPAVTDYLVRARDDGRTRVDLWPRTGRTHQLRVHAAVGLGAPILGDRLYGRGVAAATQRLHLHAAELAFTHPHTGAALHFELAAPF